MHFRRYAPGGNISARIEPSKGVLRICTDEAPAEPLADGRRRLEEEIEKTVRRISPPVGFAPFRWWEVQKWRGHENTRKEPPKIIREIPMPKFEKLRLPTPPASPSRNNPE